MGKILKKLPRMQCDNWHTEKQKSQTKLEIFIYINN